MTTTELIEALYGQLASGDAAAAAARLTPDAVLHIPGDNPLAGDHRGAAAILGVLARVDGLGGRTEVVDVLAGRSYAAAYCRVRTDAGLDNATVHLFRMAGDEMAGDQVAEVWFHNRDQAAVDAFWSAAAR
jgi:ketosteroid isomerase-like protein